MNASQNSGTRWYIGQIVVGEVSEISLRTAFPDSDIVAVGADFQINVQLRDPADAYRFLDRVRQTGASLVRLSIRESPY